MMVKVAVPKYSHRLSLSVTNILSEKDRNPEVV